MTTRTHSSSRPRHGILIIASCALALAACNAEGATGGGQVSAAQAELWAAAEAGDTLRALGALDAGADVDALDTRSNANGRRALNYAAIADRATMIGVLVRRGAGVNLANRSGFTPLLHAAEAGSASAAAELLRRGADPALTLPSGTSAVQLARRLGHLAVADAIEIAQGVGSVFVDNGDVRLAGTLSLPAGTGPFPVMVFVPGSGRTTRESDYAAVEIGLPQGIAVFRYDKRGLGGSTGTFEEVTTANSERVIALRASDVRAIVEQLATDPRIDPARIFLWGTSQGAWVAPLVASQTSRVAFVVAVVGGASPVGTVVEYERIARDSSLSIATATQRATEYAGPAGYDPIPVLSTLHLPMYWILGGLDRHTPTELALSALDAVATSGTSDITVRTFPRMNHEMLDIDTGTFPATLFPELFTWAAARLGR